jgi:hypothetical protein
MPEASSQITHKLRVQSYSERRARAFSLESLVHEGVLSTAAHAKPNVLLPVVEDLVRFLWAYDEYQMPHPQARLQLAFLILLMTLLGN